MLFVPNGSSEASPMEQSYQGNPVVVINLTYDAGIGGGNDIQEDIVIELLIFVYVVFGTFSIFILIVHS